MREENALLLGRIQARLCAFGAFSLGIGLAVLKFVTLLRIKSVRK
jgi:hypothetical protein